MSEPNVSRFIKHTVDEISISIEGGALTVPGVSANSEVNWSVEFGVHEKGIFIEPRTNEISRPIESA
jgi:hypothetical protein